MENQQPVPDFLEDMKPEGELVFDDNSEEDEEDQGITADAEPQSTEPTAASDDFEFKQEAAAEAPAAADEEVDW
jgi:ATP-dependent RNA helicase DDX3X